MIAKTAYRIPPLRELPPAPGETDVNIRPIAVQASEYALSLRGYLTPGWTGRLAAGLAEKEIDIVRGEAEKVSTISWRSSFEIRSARQADPLQIDFAELAEREVPLNREAPKISLCDYRLELSRLDGSLFVEVRALDRIGFLRDLLDYFSLKCLFPVKMTIETVGDAVQDQFWLKGMGGLKPTVGGCDALRKNLEALKRTES